MLSDMWVWSDNGSVFFGYLDLNQKKSTVWPNEIRCKKYNLKRNILFLAFLLKLTSIIDKKALEYETDLILRKYVQKYIWREYVSICKFFNQKLSNGTDIHTKISEYNKTDCQNIVNTSKKQQITEINGLFDYFN